MLLHLYDCLRLPHDLSLSVIATLNVALLVDISFLCLHFCLLLGVLVQWCSYQRFRNLFTDAAVKFVCVFRIAIYLEFMGNR